MAEHVHPPAARTLMQEMGLTDAVIERRKQIVGLESADLGKILALREYVIEHADEYMTAFFSHLANFEEARPLLANRATLERARKLKREHLIAMVQGEYGAHYVEQRLELGALYARVGLDARMFLGAFSQMFRNVATGVMKRFDRMPGDAHDNLVSLNKVAFFDLALITDLLVFERERTIRKQQEAIRELSTPVLQIRDRLLLLPIIGLVDTRRARMITDSLLRAIRANRARVVVMDITGVATIDSKVANHLLQTVTAARLMGATVIVTGLSPDVAQSLVALGIELTKLNTVGDLQGGLDEADRILGYRVIQGSQLGAAQVVS